MKIATWNIAGGHTVRSLEDKFDYNPLGTAYFVDELGKLSVDVAFIQESQCNDKGSVAARIAEELAMPFVFETPMSQSHIDPEYSLSVAILSRQPFEIGSQQAFKQPYPSFDLQLPGGRPAAKFHKYLQMATIGGICFANTMVQPLEFLGSPYSSLLGRGYADELSAFFIDNLPEQLLIFAGDFNTPDPPSTFARAFDHFGLKDTLPVGATEPHGQGHLDCILVSPEFTAIDRAIIPTQTDHYLGYAEVTTSR